MSRSRSSTASRGFVLVALSLAACTGAEAPTPEPVLAPAPAPEPVAAPAPAPAAEPRVFFVEPTEGAKVTSPVRIVMGVEGMAIAPAGEAVAGVGHHHIVIDGDAVPAGTVVPTDATHIHFGKGQTETTVELAPGPHTLRLQFADGLHQSYGEGMSTVVHIEVVAAP